MFICCSRWSVPVALMCCGLLCASVKIHGQATPLCIPPEDITLSCQAYTQLSLSAPPTEMESDDAFGQATATGSDDFSIQQIYAGRLNNCGSGVFERRFTIVAPTGEASVNPCTQTISVFNEPNYTITFPGDREGDCTEDFVADPVAIIGGECEQFIVSSTIERVNNGGRQCYDLAVTHRVINLCEFDPAALALSVRRDFDGDNNFDEAVSLQFFNGPNGDEGDVVRLDEDVDRGNGGFTPLLIANYGLAAGRGGFVYTQLVRVFDRAAPTIEPARPPACFALAGEACTGTAQLTYSVSDDCSEAGDITTRVELDLDFVAPEFERTRFLLPEEITGVGAGLYAVSVPGLPKGDHALRITAIDACGNETRRVVPFCVDEISNASPICLPSVTATISADQNGTVPVFAEQFIPADVNLCGAPVVYSIYTVAEAEVVGFAPEPNRDGLVLDCSDAAQVTIRIYALSEPGGGNFCTATVDIRWEPGACLGDDSGRIGGAVTTERGQLLPNVKMTLRGDTTMRTTATGADGRYVFPDLPLHQNYTVSAALDDYSRHPKGVTTADLVVLTEHLLGIAEFTNPYQSLAADANGDDRITVGDIIAIRRLILGLDVTYPNSTAYRFVDANFVFPLPANPWATAFSEVVEVNHLAEPEGAVDFIGVMVGDVNFSGVE